MDFGTRESPSVPFCLAFLKFVWICDKNFHSQKQLILPKRTWGSGCGEQSDLLLKCSIRWHLILKICNLDLLCLVITQLVHLSALGILPKCKAKLQFEIPVPDSTWFTTSNANECQGQRPRTIHYNKSLPSLENLWICEQCSLVLWRQRSSCSNQGFTTWPGWQNVQPRTWTSELQEPLWKQALCRHTGYKYTALQAPWKNKHEWAILWKMKSKIHKWNLG